MENENTTFMNIAISESFRITPCLRYAIVYVEVDNCIAEKQTKLQQLWIGDFGAEKWEFIETVDLTK